MTTHPETNWTAAGTPRALPFFGRYAALVAGRRSKWAVLVFRALAVAEQYFAGKDTITAVVVYARASGLTAADLGAIDADRKPA